MSDELKPWQKRQIKRLQDKWGNDILLGKLPEGAGKTVRMTPAPAKLDKSLFDIPVLDEVRHVYPYSAVPLHVPPRPLSKALDHLHRKVEDEIGLGATTTASVKPEPFNIEKLEEARRLMDKAAIPRVEIRLKHTEKVVHKIKRTWWERLKSKPFKKYRFYRDYGAYERNKQILQLKGVYYMTERVRNRLMKELNL